MGLQFYPSETNTSDQAIQLNGREIPRLSLLQATAELDE